MLTLNENPLVKIGEASGDCGERDLSVPDVCEDCRQVTRWGKRILSFAKRPVSKMQAIANAILQADDDILKSLCGLCFTKSVIDCSCFCGQYEMLGLPITVQAQTADCQVLKPATIELTCYSIEEICPDGVTVICANESTREFKELCGICETCEAVTFDPCANADHLDIMTRVYQARILTFNKRPTANTILQALDILLPGGTADIVTVQNGIVYVTAGRDLTALESQFIAFLLAQVPLGFQVQIQLVIEC